MWKLVAQHHGFQLHCRVDLAEGSPKTVGRPPQKTIGRSGGRCHRQLFGRCASRVCLFVTFFGATAFLTEMPIKGGISES